MKKSPIVAIAATALIALGVSSFAMAGESIEYEWSMDLDCTLCHQKEAASLGLIETSETVLAEDIENPEVYPKVAEISSYATMHASNFKMGCTSCHVESDGLDKGHKKLNSGKEAKRLKKSEVSSSLCITCHKTENLVEATEAFEGIVDTNGTMVNPHALPENDSHSAINCTDCHEAHSGKMIDDSAIASCLSCHHAGVFECGTCH